MSNRQADGVGAARSWLPVAFAAFVALGTPSARAESGLWPASWTMGPKKLLYIRVDFANYPGEPISAAAAQSVMGQVDAFLRRASYGKTSLAATVTPLLRVPNFGTGNLVDNARAAAAAAGYPTESYDLEIVAWRSGDGLAGGGGFLAKKGIILRNDFGFANTAASVANNYGVPPAYMAKESGVYVVSQFLPTDLFDVTGRGDGPEDDLRAYAKHFWLGWMPEAEVGAFPSGDLGSLAGTRTFRIHAIDGALAAGLHAVRIKRTYAENLWLEYRPSADGGANPWLVDGACVSIQGGTSDARLQDMGPYADQAPAKNLEGIRKSRQDAPLLVGRTYSDRSAQTPIHITPIRRNDTVPASIDVLVNAGAFAGNRAPTVAVRAGASTFADGAGVPFAAAASDPDGDALAYAWDFGDGSVSAQNAASVSHAFPSGAAREYRVRCTVTDMKGGTASASTIVRHAAAPAGLYRVSGRVVSAADGSPVHGARVADGGYSALTDSDGTYTIVNVPAGSRVFTASKPAEWTAVYLVWNTFAPRGFANPVPVASDRAGIDFAMTAGFNSSNFQRDPEINIRNFTASASTTGFIPVTDETYNGGGVSCDQDILVRYYLSKDPVIDTADTVIGSRTIVGGLYHDYYIFNAVGSDPRYPYSRANTLLPAVGIAPGTYWVGAIADPLDRIREMSDTNNAVIAPKPVVIDAATLLPDLVVDGLSASLSGRTLSILDTVRNRSYGTASSSFTVRYYLSTDAAITTADIALGTRSISSLGPMASSAGSVSLPLPSSLPAGRYYVGAIVDSSNRVWELDESNNTAVAGAAVETKADLSFASLSASISSGKIAVASKFQNLGSAATTASGFAAAFYLSEDGALDSSDLYLGSRTRTSALNVGSTDGATTKFAAPAGTPPGDYYVIGVIDSANAQPESNEANNRSATAARVSVRADLVVSALSASISGRTLTVSSTVRNDGPLPTSGSFSVLFRISADSTISAADLPLGSRTVSASLANGQTNAATVTLAIPSAVPAGSWRVGAVADGASAVPESDEANNTRASSSFTVP